MKAALLPSAASTPSVCCTKPVSDLTKPVFGDIFNLNVPLNKLYTKTLQVNVCGVSDGSQEKCMVSCMTSFLQSFWNTVRFLKLNKFPNVLHFFGNASFLIFGRVLTKFVLSFQYFLNFYVGTLSCTYLPNTN